MKNFLFSSLLLAVAFSAFGAEEEPAVVEGVLLERPDGRFLEFVLVESRIVVNFFDEEMKPIPPDVDRVAVRIDRYQPRTKTEFTVAIPFEGFEGLRAPKFIKGPQIFRANVSLMRNPDPDPVEFYVVQYPEDLNAAEPITVLDAGE